MITNGLQGIHLATNQPIEIDLNEQEMSDALYKSVTGEEKWELMCASVYKRLGIEIIGQIQIDYMVVDGIKRVFH